MPLSPLGFFLNTELINVLTRLGVTIEGVLDWMIRFIDTLYTPLGTTGNSSAVAILHTL
jgi:hypothetical protein